MNEKLKMKVANAIKDFVNKHELNTDMRLYFSGKAWDWDSNGIRTTLEDVKASDYFEYADDKGVSLSFEGGLYGALQGDYGFYHQNLWDAMLSKLGCYSELGNAWNCRIVEDAK